MMYELWKLADCCFYVILNIRLIKNLLLVEKIFCRHIKYDVKLLGSVIFHFETAFLGDFVENIWMNFFSENDFKYCWTHHHLFKPLSHSHVDNFLLENISISYYYSTNSHKINFQGCFSILWVLTQWNFYSCYQNRHERQITMFRDLSKFCSGWWDFIGSLHKVMKDLTVFCADFRFKASWNSIMNYE